MPSSGYGYSGYDTGYPVPVPMSMPYSEPYYPTGTTYYPASSYYVSLFRPFYAPQLPSDTYTRVLMAMDIGTTAIRATLMAMAHECL